MVPGWVWRRFNIHMHDTARYFKEISRQSPAVLVETQADAFNETWNRRPAVHAATKIGI